MSHSHDPHEPSRYRVSIGHHSFVVEGTCAQEAIKRVRKMLCDDMPRLWDVIQKLDDIRFEVAPAV